MSLIVGPRVLLSIADHGARHAHRTPAGSLAAPAIAAGALFGENRAAEDSSVASEAAEIRVLMEGNMREFDEAHLQEQIRLSKEVFPEMRLVGWYVICEENKPSDLVLELHQKFSRFCESPILVLVQGEENAPETDEMPISVFRLRNSRECEHLRLVVESSEMEKILVEHVAFEISTKQAQESHGNFSFVRLL